MDFRSHFYVLKCFAFMCIWVPHAWLVSIYATRGRGSDPLELELQMVVSHEIWESRIEPLSFARAINTPNHLWVLSILLIFYKALKCTLKMSSLLHSAGTNNKMWYVSHMGHALSWKYPLHYVVWIEMAPVDSCISVSRFLCYLSQLDSTGVCYSKYYK